jgi:hypothetical protein
MKIGRKNRIFRTVIVNLENVKMDGKFFRYFEELQGTRTEVLIESASMIGLLQIR